MTHRIRQSAFRAATAALLLALGHLYPTLFRAQPVLKLTDGG